MIKLHTFPYPKNSTDTFYVIMPETNAKKLCYVDEARTGGMFIYPQTYNSRATWDKTYSDDLLAVVCHNDIVMVNEKKYIVHISGDYKQVGYLYRTNMI